MRRPPQADKLRAIAALALAIAVIALGIAFSIVSPRTPAGAAAVSPTAVAPSPTPGPLTPTPTRLPYAFEGRWELDFAASGLVRPTFGPGGQGISSTLTLQRGQVEFWTGYGGGCDIQSGTFDTDGVALAIHLSANTKGGCRETTIDDVTARLGRVVALTLAPCTTGSATCRLLWLLDKTYRPVLVYAFQT